MKKAVRRILKAAACAAAVMLAAVYVILPVSAGAPPVGDVDGDGFCTFSDAKVLRNYLLTVPDARLENPGAADLDHDGDLDAADFTLMKRLLLPERPENTGGLIPSPLRVLSPSMPSAGVVRIPVFAVSFPDCEFAGEEIAGALQTSLFSAENQEDPAYPLESVSAYYSRASCGRLTLTGDVFRYTAEQPLAAYEEDHAKALAAELTAAFDAQLNYQDYDADGNGVLDAMVLALPEAALEADSDQDGRPDWWAFSITSQGSEAYDGVCTGAFCAIAYTPDERAGFVRQTAHELCHAMGLPDYYKYTADASGENDGLPGTAGKELMDEGSGDLSACSRLLLGWLTEDEVQIYTGGAQTFTITSMQYAPSCILIPREPGAGFLSEYFLIEYNTPEGNQTDSGGRGIRILHVQAEVSEGKNGPELTYENYGQHYDKSNQKQRVLRLVNDYGVYYPGKRGISYTDRIDGSTEGFHWYDADGGLTADTGLTVRILGAKAGPGYAPDPLSSREPFDDPSYWKGSSYQIQITDAA